MGTEKLQVSFNGGELDPSLHGRVDISKYLSGLETCKNFTVQAHGGVSNRAGTRFVGETKDSSKISRLIPFEFSVEQTYALEFGDLYIRVIKDGGYVLETAVNISGATQANPVVITTSGAHGYSNGDEVFITDVVGMTELNSKRYIVANETATTFELQGVDGTAYTAYSSGGTVARLYTLATTYLEADLALLKFVQDANTMTIVHPLYPPAELTRTDHDAWTIADIEFLPIVEHPNNVTITPVGTPGVTIYRYKVTTVAKETLEESLSGLGHDTEVITGATQADPVVVTISGTHAYLNGDEVEINNIVGMTELNGRRFKITNVTASTFELKNVDGTGYTAYSSGGVVAQTFDITLLGNPTLSPINYNDITWTAPTGDIERYHIYKEVNGLYGFIGSVDDGADLTFKDAGVIADTSVSPPKYLEIFDVPNGYPGTVTYFEQRLVYGATINSPEKVSLSQTGNYSNFNKSFPLRDDDAINFIISSRKVNAVRHFVPLEDLIILTSGGEWKATSGDSAFTVYNIRLRAQGYLGCSNVAPVVTNGNVLFMQARGNMVRDLAYNFETNGYRGNDLSIMARHLFRGHTIDEWALSEVPHNILWCIRSDGALLGLTYLKEHDIFAWHQHDTDGTFESVCSIPEGDEDAVYFIVKRTIDGVTKRYVERLESRNFDNVEDAYFVDSGSSYISTPVSVENITAANPPVVTATTHGYSNGDIIRMTEVEGMIEVNHINYTIANVTANTFELVGINGAGYTAYESGGDIRITVKNLSGLDHLEGKSVVILADGSVQPKRIVTDGAIELQENASEIHVGLSYESRITTLDIARPDTPTIQNKEKKVNSVSMRFYKSRGGLFGNDTPDEVLTPLKQRTTEKYGQPTKMVTDVQSIVLDPTWNSNGRFTVVQRDPLPMTILTLAPEFTISDRT